MQWNWVAIQAMLMHNKLMTINIIANPSYNDYTKKKWNKKTGSSRFSKLYRRIYHVLKSYLNANRSRPDKITITR